MNISRRFAVLLHASLFVLGFSIVFVIGWAGAVDVMQVPKQKPGGVFTESLRLFQCFFIIA
jgi:hypothetical protein